MRLFWGVALAAGLLSQGAMAEGLLREKLKERMARKLEERPVPEVTGPVDGAVTRTGDYVFSLTHDGLQRFYKIHVPASYNPATPTPLLVALHGGGGDMEYMAKDQYYGLISKSEKEGFVVAFPTAIAASTPASWRRGTPEAAAPLLVTRMSTMSASSAPWLEKSAPCSISTVTGFSPRVCRMVV